MKPRRLKLTKTWDPPGSLGAGPLKGKENLLKALRFPSVRHWVVIRDLSWQTRIKAAIHMDMVGGGPRDEGQCLPRDTRGDELAELCA